MLWRCIRNHGIHFIQAFQAFRHIRRVLFTR